MSQKWWRVMLALVLGILVSGALFAQEAGEAAEADQEEAAPRLPEDRAIEEIIVTAQKREQALMDVGIAITALTSDDMYELGLKNTQELIQFVPGLMLQQTRGAWIIRGVGTQTGVEGATAIYVDDAYFFWTGGSNHQLYDMQQTEVLKGPQGTLYGRNATGGLVHFRTANPTREAGGLVDLTVGDYNQVRAEAAYGGPLGSKVSGRIAALYSSHDGYLKSHTDGVPDADDANRWGVRGKLLIDASDTWSILLTAFVSEQDTRGNGARLHRVSRYNDEGLGEMIDDPTVMDFFGWRTPEGYDPWNHWFDSDVREIINTKGGKIKADWTGDNLSFTSITAYTEGESGYLEDVDGSPTPVATMGYNPEDLTGQNSWWTQEFNLSGGDRFRWVAGAFYLNIETEGIGELVFRETLAGDAAPMGDNSATRSEVQSWSAFGQVEYDLSDSWRVVAGLRYTDETKKQAAQPYTQFYSTGEIIMGDPFAVERTMDQPWSGKLALEFYPSDTVMTYVSYNRGIKSGGFNARSTNNPTFGDEQLNAFELGLKAELSTATSLNVAAFYYDYDGYQIRTLDFDSLTLETLNATSKIYGGEIELFSKPTQNLDLAFGLSVLDANVFDLTQIFNDELIFFEERVMQQAPPYTFNGAITYSIPLASAGFLELHTNWNLVADQEYSAYNHPSMVQESYTYGYASVKFRPPKQNWEVYAWVKNVMNELYIKGGDDLSFFGLTTQPINPPRWYGLTFRVNFGL